MPITFLLVDQSSPNRGGDVVNNAVLDFPYVNPFQKHLRSKSKVVRNRGKFFTFFTSQILLGDLFQTLYPRYHGCLLASRPVKFLEVIPTSPKVIGVNALNCKPNFKCDMTSVCAGAGVVR